MIDVKTSSSSPNITLKYGADFVLVRFDDPIVLSSTLLGYPVITAEGIGFAASTAKAKNSAVIIYLFNIN